MGCDLQKRKLQTRVDIEIWDTPVADSLLTDAADSAAVAVDLADRPFEKSFILLENHSCSEHN